MRIITQSEQRTMPWKNGAGSTLEIFVYPPQGRFAWRVSLAKVDRDGPFSIFENYERHIMVLDGEGMELCFQNGEVMTLLPMQPHKFSGEEFATATLRHGPVADFNLMVDRDYGTGRLTVVQVGAASRFECTAEHCLIYCLTGLNAGQAILLNKGEACDLVPATSIALCEVLASTPCEADCR